MGAYIHGLLIQQGMDSHVLTAFKKIRKGALVELHTNAFASAQLYKIKIAKQARDAQLKQGKKTVAHERRGSIIVA